jgi:hypothetical protein
MKRTLSGPWYVHAVDVMLYYLVAFAIWYDWGVWGQALTLGASLWLIGRSLREEALAKSLRGYAVPEKLLMCIFKAVYKMGLKVFIAFCILSAIDELDDSSGLLDWVFNQPTSLGLPVSNALDNIKVVVILCLLGWAGMRGYPRMKKWSEPTPSIAAAENRPT